MAVGPAWTRESYRSPRSNELSNISHHIPSFLVCMVNLAKNNHTTKNEKDRKEYIDIKCLCQNDTPVWFQQRFQQQQKKNKKRRTIQANQHWKTGRGIRIKDEKKENRREKRSWEGCKGAGKKKKKNKKSFSHHRDILIIIVDKN